MSNTPIAPTDETPTDAADETTETTTEESDQPAKPKKKTLAETLFGWARPGSQSAPETEGEPGEEGDSEESPPEAPIETRLPPTPILRQEVHGRGQDSYEPVSVLYLTGTYEGQEFDLGLGVNEISMSQTANWEDLDQANIRQGLSFKNLSPRTISFDVTYYSFNHDVAHLFENLKHSQEINSIRSTPAGEVPYPPLLLLTIGSMSFHVVCTEVSDKLEHPHIGTNGYKLCTTSLTFKQVSNKTTPDSLGRPATGTPLMAWMEGTTADERKKEALERIVSRRLFEGSDSQSAEIVEKMIEDDAFSDKERIMQLDAETFVNLAIAGAFDKKLLQDEEIKAKLRSDMAFMFAERENGIATQDPRYPRMLREALESGSPEGLPEVLRQQFDDYKRDFDQILDAVERQDLQSTSNHKLFRLDNVSARNRLFDIGARGLELRQAQTFSANIADAATAETLGDINKFLSEKSDKEIQAAFGLSRPGQIRIMKNRGPFVSRQHFLNELQVLEADGTAPSAIWSRFVEHAAAEKAKEQEPVPAP
jgi:hypothetical protein